jgi:hypothetical protein
LPSGPRSRTFRRAPTTGVSVSASNTDIRSVAGAPGGERLLAVHRGDQADPPLVHRPRPSGHGDQQDGGERLDGRAHRRALARRGRRGGGRHRRGGPGERRPLLEAAGTLDGLADPRQRALDEALRGLLVGPGELVRDRGLEPLQRGAAARTFEQVGGDLGAAVGLERVEVEVEQGERTIAAVHRATSSAASSPSWTSTRRSPSRAACIRLFTVPSGISKTSAISGYESP